jgi:hypothetical protein
MKVFVSRYYYSTDGENAVGPIDVNGLAALLRVGTIQRTTPAIIEGQTEWGTIANFLPNTLRVARSSQEVDEFEEVDESKSTPAKSNQPQNRLAAIASVIIPGLGQLSQGRLLAGLGYFLLAMFLWAFLLGWIVHIAAYRNAYRWMGRGH